MTHPVWVGDLSPSVKGSSKSMVAQSHAPASRMPGLWHGVFRLADLHWKPRIRLPTLVATFLVEFDGPVGVESNALLSACPCIGKM
eukprot:2301379-Pyramimonas_sp.AAC.1